jgi:hypothetical protein
MGLIGCTQLSVRNYRYSLRDNPEQRSSYPFAGKPEITHNFYVLYSGPFRVNVYNGSGLITKKMKGLEQLLLPRLRF